MNNSSNSSKSLATAGTEPTKCLRHRARLLLTVCLLACGCAEPNQYVEGSSGGAGGTGGARGGSNGATATGGNTGAGTVDVLDGGGGDLTTPADVVTTDLVADVGNSSDGGCNCAPGYFCRAGICGLGFVQLSLGGPHACGVVSDGTVRCWGDNSFAELGDGTTIGRSVPTMVPALTNVLGVASGEGHTCALRSGGEVFCWGDNKFGQVGNPDVVAPIRSPTKVAGLSTSTAIAARDFHSCSLGSDRSVQCWGFNASGQIGDPTTNANPRPSPIVATRDALSIGAGAGKTCAILLDHAVYCWGQNVGNGTEDSSTVPVRVPSISGATAVAPGSGHTCTLLSDGSARCWGQNRLGGLGDGTTVDRWSPAAVKGLSNAIDVKVASGYACALLADGTVWCWGANFTGQLGDGSVTHRSTPAPVRFP